MFFPEKKGKLNPTHIIKIIIKQKKPKKCLIIYTPKEICLNLNRSNQFRKKEFYLYK